ncbi:elevenin-Vc1-like [Pomacea canaliculata]|nr:elevenin-Vc1-like [Pomacea canaliculata]XP_025088329.1 elevenin-Vc1-like [Pomacea canaliculata]
MMAQTSACRLLLLFFIVISAVSCIVSARRIDCTKFVFAPRCRGVAAKRGVMPLADDSTSQEDAYVDPLMQPEAGRDEESEKLLRLAMDLPHAVPDQSSASQKRRELLERLLRSYNIPEYSDAGYRQE